MTWTVQFTGLAEDDVDEAYAWYASSRRGLGDEFLADVDAIMQMLERVPEVGRLSFRVCVEYSCTDFPTPSIIACFRRSPRSRSARVFTNDDIRDRGVAAPDI